jgi:hypothetical protein
VPVHCGSVEHDRTQQFGSVHSQVHHGLAACGIGDQRCALRCGGTQPVGRRQRQPSDIQRLERVSGCVPKRAGQSPGTRPSVTSPRGRNSGASRPTRAHRPPPAPRSQGAQLSPTVPTRRRAEAVGRLVQVARSRRCRLITRGAHDRPARPSASRSAREPGDPARPDLCWKAVHQRVGYGGLLWHEQGGGEQTPAVLYPATLVTDLRLRIQDPLGRKVEGAIKSHSRGVDGSDTTGFPYLEHVCRGPFVGRP